MHSNGGIRGVDVLISQDPSSVCAHLSQCNADSEDSADASFLGTDAEDEDQDEDDDEDDHQALKKKKKGRKGKPSVHDMVGSTYSQLAGETNNMMKSQSIQMLNSKQMSDMDRKLMIIDIKYNN